MARRARIAADPASAGPSAEDLAVQPAASVEDAPAAVDTPPEPTTAEAPPPKETARERVAKRYKEQRAEEVTVNQGDTSFMDDLQRAMEDDTPQAQTAEPAAKPTAAQPDADPLIELQVDGQRVQLPLSQVRELAQVNVALAARRAELSALNNELAPRRAEARAVPAERDSSATRQPPDSAVPPVASPSRLDDAQLEEAIEALTTGTVEEAKASLRGLLEAAASMAQPAMQPQQVRQEVEAVFQRQAATGEVANSLEQFRTSYPEISGDEELQHLVFNKTIQGMLSDLAQVGVPQPQLQALAEQPPIRIAEIHRSFHVYKDAAGQRRFPTVRSYGDVLNSAGESVMAWRGTPAPTNSGAVRNGPAVNVQSRQDRKAVLTPQPRTTGNRAEVSEKPNGGLPNPKQTVRAIAAMRNRRTLQPAT